ncbi:MAG: hypothetical protein AB8H12_22650 [Lewinella sp.]
MLKSTFSSFILVLVLFSGCKEEVAPPTDFSADLAYFPLELNQPKFYRMDSIIVNNTVRGVEYDTTSLEVRETLVESFVAADGMTEFRGERWDRPLSGGDWRFRQTFTERRTNQSAVRTEDNLAFTKLTFPLRDEKNWDGHTAFDDTQDIVVGGEFLDVFFDWNYRYDTIDVPMTLSTGLSFDQTILITQAETNNLIDLRSAYEVYASGVGLVERFLDARHTQCRVCCGGDTESCIDLPWDEKAEKGFILRQVLLR